jgi:hypothetical protein
MKEMTPKCGRNERFALLQPKLKYMMKEMSAKRVRHERLK